MREEIENILGSRHSWTEAVRLKTGSMENVRDMADTYENTVNNLLALFKKQKEDLWHKIADKSTGAHDTELGLIVTLDDIAEILKQA